MSNKNKKLVKTEEAKPTEEMDVETEVLSGEVFEEDVEMVEKDRLFSKVCNGVSKFNKKHNITPKTVAKRAGKVMLGVGIGVAATLYAGYKMASRDIDNTPQLPDNGESCTDEAVTLEVGDTVEDLK